MECVELDRGQQWAIRSEVGSSYVTDIEVAGDVSLVAVSLRSGEIYVLDGNDGRLVGMAEVGYWQDLAWAQQVDRNDQILVVATSNGLKVFGLGALPDGEP